MAIALVGERLAAGTTLVSGGFSLASNSSAGNHLILMYAQGNNAALSAVSDSKGNTWTVDAVGASSSGANVAIASCYLTAALLTSDTITLSGVVDGGSSLQIEEFSGLAVASWKDQSATNSGTGTTLTSGTTGTTSQADELVIGAYGWSSSPTSFAAGGSMSLFASNNAGSIWLGCEYQIISSAGTQTAPGTAGASTNWWGAVATYKAAAASGKTGAGILG